MSSELEPGLGVIGRLVSNPESSENMHIAAQIRTDRNHFCEVGNIGGRPSPTACETDLKMLNNPIIENQGRDRFSLHL
jgi:hypothetical protein